MIKLKEIRWKATGIELFYITVVVLACVKMVYALSDTVDLQLYDETAYLRQGSRFQISSLFTDGALYLVWYKLLSYLVTDAITLYYLNYTLLLCLNPLLIYILLRKMGKSAIIGALFSILFLISAVNMTANPFITRYALALILCILIGVRAVKNKKAKYLVALCGISLLVYTRPEYILSLFIFAAASVIYLVKRYRQTRKPALVYLVLLTVALSLFILVLKNPAGSKRSVIAFGQHYAVHMHNRGKISEDPNTHWEKIMDRKFKTHTSIARAFINNPSEMLRHVAANIKDIPYQAMQLFFPYPIENKLIKKILIVTAGILFILLMIRAAKKRKKDRHAAGRVHPAFPGNLSDDGIFYIILFVLMIPPVISVCLIYPREHYLLVVYAILILIAAKNAPRIQVDSKIAWVQYAAILFIFYWIPWHATGAVGLNPGHVESIHNKTCTNVGKIKFIRSMQGENPIVYLGYGGSIEPYVKNLKYVDKHSKDVPFNEFIQREGIDMIQVDQGMLKDPRFAADREFLEFTAKIPGNDWQRVEMPHCAGYMAVKRKIPE